ncbi:hypothetical protein HID58_080393, partial [Brassica napus]
IKSKITKSYWLDEPLVFGNSRFESRYNDGDTLWVDGSGRLREGKMGIVRRCQWDSISKKGFKGFGWILEIMEIKTWAVRLRLCRLAQTNFVKIRSYQDFKRRRRCIKGEERRRGALPVSRVSRERSPRDHFPEQERSKGRTYEGTMRSTQLSGAGETQQEVHPQRDGDVILAHVNGLGSDQVRMGNEKVENGLDVVNEVMLEQENLVKADDMDTDENNSSLKEGEVTNGGEEEFQDVTDEEIDGNQGVTQGDIVASIEMSEEGELEKAENVGGEEKNKGVKKKLFKGGPLVVGTSKMRMVHSLISPRKRLPSKPNPKQGEGTKQGDGMKQGDGTKQGAEHGTSNPKPPINKH